MAEKKKAAKSSEDSKDKLSERRLSRLQKHIDRLRIKTAIKYGLSPEDAIRSNNAVKDVLTAMDEISYMEYCESLNTAVRKGMKLSPSERDHFDKKGGAAGILTDEMIDRAGYDISRTDFSGETVSYPADDLDTFRIHNSGSTEINRQDTFRNLIDISRMGIDIAVAGGTYEEIRNGMYEEFERRRAFGCDMDFRYSAINANNCQEEF